MSRADPTRTPPPVVLLAGPGVTDEVVEAVGRRAVAESGASLTVVDPGADDAETVVAAARGAGGVVLFDARWLAPETVYGDLVADPRDEPAVLEDGRGEVVGVRLVAAQRYPGADGAPVLRQAAAVARRDGAREVRPGDFVTAWADGGLERARAVVDAQDEAATRLRRSSRSDDGFLSAFLIRPLSRQVTRRAVRTRLRPSQITAVSLLLGLGSAVAFAGGTPAWRVAGSALLLLSLVVDCVDGEVARYTRTFSALGGWLDVASDRAKEYAVYAGLVLGSDRVGGGAPWTTALAAMVVLVVRHFVDFGYAASPGVRTSRSAVGRLSTATSRRSGLKWAKRAVIMPVGERTILLIVLAPAFSAQTVLRVLLVLGLLAGVYTTLGRLGRSRSFPGEPAVGAPGAQRLLGQCDAAPIPDGVLAPTARHAWLSPAASRLLEAAAVGGVGLWVGSGAALAGAYALLAVAALRDYDLTYRQRLAGVLRPEDWLRPVGWPWRAAAGVALVLAARAGAGWVAIAVAAVAGVLVVTVSARSWRVLASDGP